MLFNKSTALTKAEEKDILNTVNTVFDGVYTKILSEKNGLLTIKNSHGSNLIVKKSDVIKESWY